MTAGKDKLQGKLQDKQVQVYNAGHESQLGLCHAKGITQSAPWQLTPNVSEILVTC